MTWSGWTPLTTLPRCRLLKSGPGVNPSRAAAATSNRPKASGSVMRTPSVGPGRSLVHHYKRGGGRQTDVDAGVVGDLNNFPDLSGVGHEGFEGVYCCSCARRAND